MRHGIAKETREALEAGAPARRHVRGMILTLLSGWAQEEAFEFLTAALEVYRPRKVKAVLVEEPRPEGRLA